MDYFYLILQTLLFSFGGITIKYSGNAFSPFMTSLLRFLLGMTILFVIQKIRRKPITLKLANKWIIFGGIMKACHYLCENYGVMKGNSFGTVIVLPAQTFTVLLFSTFTMPAMTGSFGPLPAIGILTLGCCTGIGFLLQALAMRSVSVLIATVIQSSMSILSIFWSAVLYHDEVSIYAVIGTCIFVVGILLINIRFTSDSVGRSR